MCIVNFSTDTVDTDHPQFCFCFLSYLIDVQNLWISSHGPPKQFGRRKNHFYLPKLNAHQPENLYDSLRISIF